MLAAQGLAGAPQLEQLDWSLWRAKEPSDESLSIVASLPSLRRLRAGANEIGAVEGAAASIRERVPQGVDVAATEKPWFRLWELDVGSLRLSGLLQ